MRDVCCCLLLALLVCTGAWAQVEATPETASPPRPLIPLDPVQMNPVQMNPVQMNPVQMDPVMIEAEVFLPGYAARPRPPDYGKRHPLVLRANFRARVLASAGAL